MELSIKNHNSINFQASKRKTQKGNEYYHSNKALIAGSGTCALATGLSAYIAHNKKIPNSKAAGLACFGFTAPLILIGALADKLTNKERQQTADLIAEVGVENAPLIDDTLKVSKKRKLYKPTESATLISLPGILGILTLSGISHLLFKKGIVKNDIFDKIGFIAKSFVHTVSTGGVDEVSFYIAALPISLSILPLIATDWLNNLEAKRKS